MTQQQIETSVQQFVAEKFMFGQGADKLTKDTSFLDLGVIDSTGVLELVMFLEQTFGIKVGDEEIVPDNLDSVRKIGEYVLRKRGAAHDQRKTVTGAA
jgi:acyl carrier protein